MLPLIIVLWDKATLIIILWDKSKIIYNNFHASFPHVILKFRNLIYSDFSKLKKFKFLCATMFPSPGVQSVRVFLSF